MQHQLLLAHVPHEFVFFFNQNNLAVIDDANAVRKLFSFFDVMCGQDYRYAFLAQCFDDVPHVLPQFDVYTCRRFVEKQDLRFVRQRLGDEHTTLHAAGQSRTYRVFLVPERKRLQHFLQVFRVGTLAEQTTTEPGRV